MIIDTVGDYDFAYMLKYLIMVMISLDYGYD